MGWKKTEWKIQAITWWNHTRKNWDAAAKEKLTEKNWNYINTNALRTNDVKAKITSVGYAIK